MYPERNLGCISATSRLHLAPSSGDARPDEGCEGGCEAGREAGLAGRLPDRAPVGRCDLGVISGELRSSRLISG